MNKYHTINMSEFSGSTYRFASEGAPPGYVGYGEGGRLTEACAASPTAGIARRDREGPSGCARNFSFRSSTRPDGDGNGRVIDFKNTRIILTSNVGTEVIMHMAERATPGRALRAFQRHAPVAAAVFPPALLGRIVTIPYFPLSGEMLGGIVRLALERIRPGLQTITRHPLSIPMRWSSISCRAVRIRIRAGA